MMIIEVQKLNMQKKYSGTYEFSYDAPKDLIPIPYVDYLKPVKVEVSYWILEDDSVEVKGSVKYTLHGECSRCLKETQCGVNGEIDAYFIPRGAKKTDEDDYEYANGALDLSECVNDAIMLSMPYVLICSENCKGIEYKN